MQVLLQIKKEGKPGRPRRTTVAAPPMDARLGRRRGHAMEGSRTAQHAAGLAADDGLPETKIVEEQGSSTELPAEYSSPGTASPNCVFQHLLTVVDSPLRPHCQGESTSPLAEPWRKLCQGGVEVSSMALPGSMLGTHHRGGPGRRQDHRRPMAHDHSGASSTRSTQVT